jgi:hypothetical protein
MTGLRRKAIESLRRKRDRLSLVSMVIGASAFTCFAYHKIVA